MQLIKCLVMAIAASTVQWNFVKAEKCLSHIDVCKSTPNNKDAFACNRCCNEAGLQMEWDCHQAFGCRCSVKEGGQEKSDLSVAELEYEISMTKAKLYRLQSLLMMHNWAERLCCSCIVNRSKRTHWRSELHRREKSISQQNQTPWTSIFRYESGCLVQHASEACCKP